jgi:hypothetical protein
LIGSKPLAIPWYPGGSLGMSHHRHSSLGQRVFLRDTTSQRRLIAENAAFSDWLSDYSTALENDRSDLMPRIADGEAEDRLCEDHL